MAARSVDTLADQLGIDPGDIRAPYSAATRPTWTTCGKRPTHGRARHWPNPDHTCNHLTLRACW
jgi:hypothetical protein